MAVEIDEGYEVEPAVGPFEDFGSSPSKSPLSTSGEDSIIIDVVWENQVWTDYPDYLFPSLPTLPLTPPFSLILS